MKKDKEKINRAEKRKTKLEQKRKTMKKMMMISVMIIAVICLSVFYMFFTSGNENIQSILQTQPRIPLSDISSDAKFYAYDADGVEIRYFAVNGPDEDIHVALDACDVCYGVKKGYTQIDDVMQCINCGRIYPINSIGTENLQGGCWPSYLPMKMDGNDIIIEISDLQEKRFMFE